MRNLREIVPGILIALVSVALILGSLSLAFSEDSPTFVPSSTLPPSSTATFPPLPTDTQTGPSQTLAPALPSLTFTAIIFSPSPALTAVPATPAPTRTSCSPPVGWVQSYTVQPGDTLYRISGLYGIGAAQLQHGNCLSSTVIVSGQRLWVPNIPTRTFTASVTSPASATPTPSDTPTASVTPSPPSETVTSTPTDIPPTTETPTGVPPTESPTSFPRTDTPTATP